jgi:hypothetical protein
MPEEHSVFPMRQLLRELCPAAFAPIEKQLAQPDSGWRYIGTKDGYDEFETCAPTVAFANPAIFARLAAALADQLASGAVDRWLAEHPSEAITREQVVEHLANLRQDRSEPPPEPGEAVLCFYDLPVAARH